MDLETETFTSNGVVTDTRRGLRDDPKWISSLYFYDERGSRLFEAICETEEYYPTRTERSLLAEHADAILECAGPEITLAELGSGSSFKTRVILEALVRRQGTATYLPVDVSGDYLERVATGLEQAYPGLAVEPIAAEYGEGLHAIGRWEAKRRLVLFLGSSIGNFEPDEQEALLRAAHDALLPGDAFLFGTDMVKDPVVLEAAYNDAAGVTAAFNKNILRHLNRRLDGDADESSFQHVALWNEEFQRIEMHLESKRQQTLHFPRAELDVALDAGERIHTENSYKFTNDRVQEMATQAGFGLETTWCDEQGWFCLHLLRRA